MEIHVSNSDELMCSSYCNLQLRQHILMCICIYFTAETEHGGNKDKAPDQTRRCAGLQTEPR